MPVGAGAASGAVVAEVEPVGTGVALSVPASASGVAPVPSAVPLQPGAAASVAAATMNASATRETRKSGFLAKALG